MGNNYVKLSKDRTVQIDDIIFISEIQYGDESFYYDIIYADKNHIRLYGYGSMNEAQMDKDILEKCLNYIDIMNEDIV